jgi:hypothetical protein
VTPPETSRGSYLGGTWFVFSEESHRIAAWGSALTGLERIHVDGALVSEKRALQRDSAHEFDVAGHHYRVSFKARLWQNATVCCRLDRDGAPVGVLRARRVQRRFLQIWQLFVMAIVLCGTTAWVAETFDLSQWPLYAGGAILALGSYVYLITGSKIVIEPGES